MKHLMTTTLFALTTLAALASTTTAAYACAAVPSGLRSVTHDGDPEILDLYETGIWAVWFHPDAYSRAIAKRVANHLTQMRCDAIGVLNMRDPEEVTDLKLRVNVILHVSDDDFVNDGIDNEWGSFVGGDESGAALMGLGDYFEDDIVLLDHEGWHVFQLASGDYTFESGEGSWVGEASADWYSWINKPENEEVYGSIGTISGAPHVSMFLGWTNIPASIGDEWYTDTRQYAMNSFIDHLQARHGLSPQQVTEGYYSGPALISQAYYTNLIGQERFKDSVADFAANLTAAMIEGADAPLPRGWILNERQRDLAVESLAGHVEDEPRNRLLKPVSAIVDASGPSTRWTTSARKHRPAAYGYNVVELDNPTGSPTLEFQGKASDFRLKLVINTGNRWVIQSIAAGDTLDLDRAASAYLIVAYTPDRMVATLTGDYGIRLR